MQNALAQAAAIGRSQAVIEFKLDGTIVTANENFLDALGYTLGEIQGKHHRMFVDAVRARQRGVSRFLGDAEARRVPGRSNTSGSAREAARVWIQATYNPILDASGRPTGVVKFATDITAQKIQQHGGRRPDRGDPPGAGGH